MNARYHVERRSPSRVAGRAHVSDERRTRRSWAPPAPSARCATWLDGRAVLVVNGDTWTDVDLAPLLDGWDGERVRVLVARPAGHDARGRSRRRGVARAGGRRRRAAGDAARARRTGCGGRRRPQAGDSRSLAGDGAFVACDTPADYLAANLAASGGASVVGDGAVVDGAIERSVVWPGAVVRAARRSSTPSAPTRTMTVLVRRSLDPLSVSAFSAQYDAIGLPL